MKRVYFIIGATFLLAFCCPGVGRAQFFKNVLNSVKQTVQNKTSQATNKVLDKVDDATKGKPAAPTASTTATPPTTPTTPPATAGMAPVAPPPNDPDPESTNGYVRMKLSASKVLVGGAIKITGFSVLYGNLKQVILTVSGPSSEPPQNLPLKDSGSFSTVWRPQKAGAYKLIVKTSDGKAQQSAVLNAYQFIEMDSLTGDAKQEAQKAYDKLAGEVEQIDKMISSKDADALRQKMKDLTRKKDDYMKVLGDLDQAGKGLDDIEKKYGSIPSSVSGNLSQLSDVMAAQTEQMRQANITAAHEPSDNTICEYLAMIGEACAAFSTFTDFYAKVPGILGNLVSDKAVPATVGAAGGAVGAGDGDNAAMKEIAKLFVSGRTDADFGKTALSAAGMAGDLVQMCSDMLMKQYCSVLNGDVTESYQCTFSNSSNAVWWKYKYTTAATINLRYPKDNQNGKLIKMKGNIEGNATKFTIFQDVNEMDDFKTAIKGRARAISICVYAPPAAPFATSQADRATGFGAVARAIVTPAYFNIPVDGDYDVENQKLTLYLNPAIMDFGPQVSYIYCYLIIAAGIPLTTRVNFPINKVRLTLNKVISENKTFDVHMDAQHNLSISGKGTAHVGGGSIEHVIDFSLSAKSN